MTAGGKSPKFPPRLTRPIYESSALVGWHSSGFLSALEGFRGDGPPGSNGVARQPSARRTLLHGIPIGNISRKRFCCNQGRANPKRVCVVLSLAEFRSGRTASRKRRYRDSFGLMSGWARYGSSVNAKQVFSQPRQQWPRADGCLATPFENRV